MTPVTIVIASAGCGDPGEAAHGVDEVFLAGPGQHDAGEQDQPAEPHRHRQRVGDADGVAENGELTDRPG